MTLTEENDETTYLLSSPANVQRLEQARSEFEKGQWIEVEDLDLLFSTSGWERENQSSLRCHKR